MALLKDVMDQVKASRVKTAVATENHYTLPEMLEGGQLEVNDVTEGFKLNIPGKVGETLLTGSFGATNYSMELESGTVVTPEMLNLSSPKKNSSDITVTEELVVRVGTDATQFSNPIRIVLNGMGKKRVFIVQNETLSSVTQMKEDSASGMKKDYGYVRNGSDLILWMKKGGEIVLGNSAVLPSTSPTPSAPPVTIPNTGTVGGGTTISGIGGGISGVTGNQQKEETKQNVQFVDITGHWAETAICEMAKKGIVSGVTAETFEPDRSITRAEFAALVVRSLNISVRGKDFMFKDVSSDDWYAEAVMTAATAGLIAGYEGYFRPEDTITREEMAIVVMKAYSFLGKTPIQDDLKRFEDSDEISDWAKIAVEQAVGSELINGMSDSVFAPKEQATRAQATSILKRLLD